MIIRPSAAGAAAAALIAVAGLAGCSSDSAETAPSASPSPSATAAKSASAKPTASASGSAGPSGAATAATVEFNKKVQQELNAVGCHAGPVDGVMGGSTDAAILRFQEASGLTPDGELGPQTDAALDRAAAAGETVCTQTTSTPSPTVTHASGVSCTAASLSSALPDGGKIVRFNCADYLDDRIAAGKVQTRNGPNVSFYARVEGNSWAAMDANQVCGEFGPGLPEQIFQYCSDGE